MTFALEAGIQVSLDQNTWYKLTDHNRSEISIKPEIIEKSERMANGMMRKYVISKKDNISTSWNSIPSKTSRTVDLNYSASWLEAFYYANVNIPIYIKVKIATEEVPTLGSFPTEVGNTSSNSDRIYRVFMSNFQKSITHRNSLGDMVNMSIEFIEV